MKSEPIRSSSRGFKAEYDRRVEYAEGSFGRMVGTRNSASGLEMTLKEIGDKYGLSRERIRQIQEQAICMIRKQVRDVCW